MNGELFSFAMNEIDDRYIEESITYKAPAKHRRTKAVLRYALAACIAAALCFGTAFAVSAEFRKSVYGWLRERYESFNHYEYRDGDKSNGSISRYRLEEIPPGYTEIENIFDEEIGQHMMVYLNKEEGKLCFATVSNGGNAYVEAEGYTVRRTEVSGVTGDMYIAEDPSKDNSIVWMKDEIFFCISGAFDPEELIYYAERLIPVYEDEEMSESEKGE